ncbi:hypothetical protein [Ligilactobacillus ruminis]|jgi:uncharacterized membrane protein YagU involved in acid resistance|nr:hypothetical protein [Ligilactobacillus ruminis]
MIKKKESFGKLLKHGHCIWQSNWDEILAGFYGHISKIAVLTVIDGLAY